MTIEEAKLTLVATQAMLGIVAFNDGKDSTVDFSKRFSEAVTIACDALDAVHDKEVKIEKPDDQKGDK